MYTIWSMKILLHIEGYNPQTLNTLVFSGIDTVPNFIKCCAVPSLQMYADDHIS